MAEETLTAPALAERLGISRRAARRMILEASRDTSGTALPVVRIPVTRGNGARVLQPAVLWPCP